MTSFLAFVPMQVMPTMTSSVILHTVRVLKMKNFPSILVSHPSMGPLSRGVNTRISKTSVK